MGKHVVTRVRKKKKKKKNEKEKTSGNGTGKDNKLDELPLRERELSARTISRLYTNTEDVWMTETKEMKKPRGDRDGIEVAPV